MRLVGALAIVAVFSLSMCSVHQGNASVDAARTTLSDLVARLDRDEVSRIDVLFVPPRVLTRVPITSEAIETTYHYKFTIRDLRNGLYHRELADAVKTLSLEPRADAPDVRWGVIFYDPADQRIAGIFLDGAGRAGAVDQNSVEITGELHDWLRGAFLTVFR